MCGRYTRYLSWSEIHRLYRLTAPAEGSGRNTEARYNIAPTQSVDFITWNDDGNHKLREGRWWPCPRSRSAACRYSVATGSDALLAKGARALFSTAVPNRPAPPKIAPIRASVPASPAARGRTSLTMLGSASRFSGNKRPTVSPTSCAPPADSAADAGMPAAGPSAYAGTEALPPIIAPIRSGTPPAMPATSPISTPGGLKRFSDPSGLRTTRRSVGLPKRSASTYQPSFSGPYVFVRY
ncbi:SOS response-associated peptidase family protein [Mesorhizobium sp. SP-1A]|uniref:SOS response-associated peptidase family protein n=1 Tax=Mesorhizobium sp. SP-1A TaxID=3077840 RepID=UPI0039657494